MSFYKKFEKKEKDHEELSRRDKLLQRMYQLTGAYWTSPRGKLCKISGAGLYVAETDSCLPWGDVSTADLELILRNNERDLTKDMRPDPTPGEIKNYRAQIAKLVKRGSIFREATEAQIPRPKPQKAPQDEEIDLPPGTTIEFLDDGDVPF